MKKFNPFKFKAIETRYDGYHFRSRQEARWACFLKTAGIRYEYEKEGFDLEGTWYLPDFWLPELDCFVEVKGQEPTEEEIFKARQLALFTGKHVNIVSGTIVLPSENNTYTIHQEWPPMLAVQWFDEETGTHSYRDIEMSWQARTVIQRLDEIYMGLEVRNQAIAVKNPWNYSRHIKDIPDHLETTLEQCKKLSALLPLLEECEEELFHIYNLLDGQYINHLGQDFGRDDVVWMECFNCHQIEIRSLGYATHRCTGHKEPTFIIDTPRLIDAYIAARQARF